MNTQRKPEGRLTRFGAIFWLVAFIACLVFAGCSPEQRGPLEASKLRPDDINVYVDRTRINYAADTISKVAKAFGRPGATTPLPANELGPVNRVQYGGVAVDYYVKTGSLIRVTIVGKEALIEGRIGIGSTREDVLKALIGGILDPKEETYLFMIVPPDGSPGVGYDIQFGSNSTVKEILVGTIPLGP